MLKSSAKDDRKAILNAISKHPNTRFAKLFHEVDEAPNQKNIVLLLIEWTQQKDFYVDFNVPLQYFLNLYEKLDADNKEFLFNEAGLLVFNATQIYSRRVDCVQQRLEDQLGELSSGKESQDKKNEDETNAEILTPTKPKRRKRLTEAPTDPFEIEAVSRKFRKITSEKRFATSTKIDTSKIYNQNLHAENYTHPALWQHAEIIDLENDEEIDSKRNYRLFTYHLEHRYNTLVPDINFKLYFKMKDFMDEEDENYGDNYQETDWPPLSQEYVKRYLDLEDEMLMRESTGVVNKKLSNKKKGKSAEKPCEATIPDAFKQFGSKSVATLPSQADSGIDLSFQPSVIDSTEISLDGVTDTTALNESESMKEISDANKITTKETNEGKESTNSIEDSTNLSESLINDMANTALNSTTNTELNSKQKEASAVESMDVDKCVTTSCTNLETTTATTTMENYVENDCGKLLDKSNESTEYETQRKTQNVVIDKHLNTLKKNSLEDSLEIVVHIESDGNDNCVVSADSRASLSPSTDEGVYFSDIDDTPMTPFTMHLNPKTLMLNDSLDECGDSINNGATYNLPEDVVPVEWPVEINILEFPYSVLKKMRKKVLLTNLGDDMELFLKARCYKRSRTALGDSPSNPRQFKFTKLFNTDTFSSDDLYSPPPSPGSDIDFLGFTEDGEMVSQQRTDEVAIEDIVKSPSKGDKSLRLSRDSGVGNDLLTASPEKNFMFFPPIAEEDDEIKRGLFEDTPILEKEHDAMEEGDEANPIRDNCAENEKEKEDSLALEQDPNVPSLNYDKELSIDVVDEAFVEDSEEIGSPATPKEKNVLSTNTLEHSKQNGTAVFDNDENTNLPDLNFPTTFEDSNSEISHSKRHSELSEDTATKIQRWHKHLQPILTSSRERHHFDVFQIGTNIIDQFHEQETNGNQSNSITFQSVMEHQDPSYVSRYYLSLLLLANQGNIALNVINKSDTTPSEWNDIHLKLKSTIRHVVSVEDNIGLAATKKLVSTSQKIKTNNKSATPKLSKISTPSTNSEMQSPPAKKRCVSTLNFNLNRIEMIKPIEKVSRSSDEDSGIYSLEDLDI